MRRCLILPFLAASSVLLHANPTGGVVASGAAGISGQGSSAVTINQTSHTAIINWQSFSIGANELTKFIQPSSTSAALNRVLGGQTSFLNGTLSANGQIFLINGNGIVVGKDGIITTAGFTGSTRDISNADFTSGKLHFMGSSDAGVQNLGSIDALGGNVVLMGKTVDNQGTITTSGTAGLVAGDDITLAQQNSDGSTITVNPVSAPSATAATSVGVHNSGSITASSAELKAANGNIYALAIQNEGIVRATTVTQQGGHIYLTDDAGTIVNSGTLDASATATKGQGGSILLKSATGRVIHSGKLIARGGAGGKGGSAEISGAQLQFTGTVDLTAVSGTTGNLLLDPATLNVITGGSGTVQSGQNDTNSTTIDPTTVDNALNTANLTLNANTNITVTNAIAWNSGNNLALTTNTAGSTIKINAGITDTHTGSGSLTISTAGATDQITTGVHGTISVPDFILERGAWKQLVTDGSNGSSGTLPAGSALPAFSATSDFEIGTNATFLRADGGNGGDTYYGLEDIYGIQGMKGFLSSNFTLNGRTVEASSTSNWNSGEGFQPIGSTSNPYQGNFDDGSIQNLTISRSGDDYIGLFSVLGGTSNVSNIEINNANITGGSEVGTLAGEIGGQVNSCYIFGGSVTGQSSVGGYAGYTTFGSNLSDDNAYYVSVSGQSLVGGVSGENQGLIYSFQQVQSTVTGNREVGGIAGINDIGGTIQLCTNSGSVQNDDTMGESSELGGIAGVNDGTITQSNTYPGATVTGDEDVGGIAGYNDGFINDSYNVATVTGTGTFEDSGTEIGGIAGENNSQEENEDDATRGGFSGLAADGEFGSGGFNPNSGVIQTSYNSGTIDGTSEVGGIVGVNDYNGQVNTCYNVGNVGDSNTSYSGGIVGDNYGYVTNTYSSGFVMGDPGTSAGIIGFDEDYADTENSYWDISTSGQTLATNSNAGNEEDEGTPADENNLASVSTIDGSAYTIAGNDPGSGAGYGFFGTATLVAGTNGVYEIGSSPDSGGGPAWYIIEGQTRPLLAMEANANINNAHQLQLIAENLSGGYDITYSFNAGNTNNLADVWSAAGFVPIGADPGVASGNVAFTGNVYGNGENLYDLFINRPTTDDVGIFGYAGSGASITNFNMYDSSITGDNNVGGIIGDNAGTVTNMENNNDQSAPTVSVTGNGNNSGGIVGLNEAGGMVGEDINTGTVNGLASSIGIGGLAGTNHGHVTQSYGSGNIGGAGETNVGGLVGDNFGIVDDSYVGQSTQAGSVTGDTNVGGAIGHNESAATFETSYSITDVEGAATSSGPVLPGSVLPEIEGPAPTNIGALVGLNDGVARHSYWENDNSNSALPGIGQNNNMGGTTDVVGYSNAQLMDANNFAQGASPIFWDFSPQTGNGGGIWGINAFNSNGVVNGGLPFLQWQTPVQAQVTATSGTQQYGFTPTYTVTGQGASLFPTEVPNPTITTSGGDNAGDTETIAVSGTPIYDSNHYGYTVEYVNGTVNITEADLTITANSYTIPLGYPAPNYTATYTGLQNGDTPNSLDGTLVFTVTPQPDTAAGVHIIAPSGQSSSNYNITYVNGRLIVTSPAEPPSPPTMPTQPVLTFESEITSVQSQFNENPTNGLDPLYFIPFLNQFGLAGDLFGGINDEPLPTDFAFASSTSNLPARERLITPGTGVVEIIDGVVVIGCPENGNRVFLSNPGTCLPQDATNGLRGVLSSTVYQQLTPLIHGH